MKNVFSFQQFLKTVSKNCFLEPFSKTVTKHNPIYLVMTHFLLQRDETPYNKREGYLPFGLLLYTYILDDLISPLLDTGF